MKKVDGEYIRINGQLQHASFVFADTPENRKRLNDFQLAYKAWKETEPNVYVLLNAMEKAQ